MVMTMVVVAVVMMVVGGDDGDDDNDGGSGQFLPRLPSPTTYVLNGYSVPGVVWALVTQHPKTGTAPVLMEFTLQWRKQLNKETKSDHFRE